MKLIVTILALYVALASSTASADFAKAGAAITKGDYATAYNELLPLAEQGNVRAQYNIALMYDNGLGVPLVDYDKAVKWYSKAAEQGLPDAQHNLAVIYAGGKSIPQDLVQAYFWFDLAAASGMDTAKQNRD
ncbi:MAG: sel1 repeat family protein, partial [Anaerolineales bacterium]|nr:sel1 repeat family protein [Anaerolineales bacterium]